jgi:hypothetical protein
LVLPTDDRYLFLLLLSIFLHDNPSPQDSPAETPSTLRWTRPSFLSSTRDGEGVGPSRYNGPFVSLLIPPWLLAYLPSHERTATVPRGVSLTLKVEHIAHPDRVGVHEHLDIWTRCFRRKSDVNLWDVDDLRSLLPQKTDLERLVYQLSVTDDAPDRESIVLQELGRYLETNSQVRVLHLLSITQGLTTHHQGHCSGCFSITARQPVHQFCWWTRLQVIPVFSGEQHWL